MGLKVMCWLNDREFKKRGHVSGDLCFSCLCIFPCTWYFLVETKTPPCISICKCIYGICRLDWYPSVLTHRLQVENWWKTRFHMLFFSLTLNDFFPAPLFVRNTSSVIFSLCSSQKKRYFSIFRNKHKVKDEARFLLWNDLVFLSKCIWKF